VRREVLVAAALALLACSSPVGGGTPSPSITGEPSPRVSSAPTPLPPIHVARSLGPAPDGCGDAVPLLRDEPPWGRVFGASPAFGAFYARADATAGAFHVGTDTRRTRTGWRVKVLWVLRSGTSEPVTITGQEAVSEQPVVFRSSGTTTTTSTTMLLDPTNPGTPSERKGWTEYPSELRFPTSGCYRITATWASGSWVRGLGFGR